MKKLNLIERLWTDSHEKQKVRGMQKYCILLLLLFTCVTHAYAKIVYYNNNGQSGDVKIHAWNTGSDVMTPWASDPIMNHLSGNIYYYDIGTYKYCIFRYGNNKTSDLTVPTDGKNYMPTYNASNNDDWTTIDLCDYVTEAPSAVISGTNVMFYYQGYCDGNCNNRLIKKAKDILSGSTSLTGGYGYANAAKSDLQNYYYISNNPTGWGGNSNTSIKTAQGGELFNGKNTNNEFTPAKTAETEYSIDGDIMTISTECNSATGVYDSKQLYIQYYIDGDYAGVKYDGVACNPIPAHATDARESTFDISGLDPAEDHTLLTVLTDGLIYYIADETELDLGGSALYVRYYANSATSGTVPVDDTAYSDGDAVTVATNSGNLERTGYEFTGWNTSAEGDGSHYAATGSATFTIHETTSLYAEWNELTYTVTLVNATAGSVTAGCATRPTITAATAPFGMAFDHWDVCDGASVASTTSSTTTVSATAAGTVTAVYTQKLYAFIEGRFRVADASSPRNWTNTFGNGNWDQNSTRIPFSYDPTNHVFYLHTYAKASELSTKISSYNPYFYIKTSTSSSSAKDAEATIKSYKCNESRTITAVGYEDNKVALDYTHDNTTNDKNDYLRFNSTDATAYITIFFDGTYIWYEYMPAIINTIDLSPSRVPPLATIMATPSMYYKGHTDKAYCWGVYTDEDCTRQVSNVSFISLGDGTVQFAAPETRGTYYLKLTVRASDACDASIDAEKVVSFTVTTEDMVFFKNVPGWGNVHFYYLGKAYWNGSVDGDDGLGSGCNTSVDGGAARGMTRIGNSDIYYYDYSGNSAIKTHLASNPITYIAFTDNYKPTSDHFSGCQAIYRGDFSACAPMLVPENYITCHKNTSAGDGSAAYYQRGYWTNYMSESSGFTLYVWDVTSGSGNEITRHTMTGTAGNNTYTYTYNFENDPQKHKLPYTYGFKFLGCGGSYYGASSTMDITNCTDWNLGTGTNNCGLSVTSKMEHTFILTLAGDGHVQVSVEYPVRVGDYRLLYDDETQDPQASQFIRQRANGKDTVAMYIRPTATEELKVQRCSGIDGETITWTDYDWKTDVDTIYVAGKPNGVYNFYLEQDASGNLTVNTSETKPYTGQYYIRTSVVDGGWNSYKSSADNLMTYAQYPDDRGYGFNYYKAKWVEATGSDVTYTIACDYSPALCKTLEGDPENNPLSAAEARNLPHSANIRFGWHSKTNQLKREYINGSSTISDRYLVMIGDSKLMNPDGTPLAISGLNANEISFTDLNNWIYRCDVKAQEGAAVRLVANYDGHTQDFIGSEGEPEEIIGGTGSEKYVMRVTYDFKTNRLMTAWLPSGNIDKDMTLKADMLLIRKGQNAATQVHFTGAYSISEIHTIYGVLEFQYDSIAGKFSSWSSTNAYKYLMYYLSFPFDVKVSEIFGCGVRGTNWIIQKYNGAKRAQIGWFAETSTFWETLPGDSTLHANEGYLLILDRISFNDASSSLWYKQGSGNSIYLYFPSTSATSGTISESTATIKVPKHTCTINRSFYVDEKIGTVNHKNTDSHWNVIGTPLFENKTASTVTTGPTVGVETLQYYYAWDYDDNSLIARSALTTSTAFKSMHGYMVQYAGDVTFEGAKLTPPSSVSARHMPSDKKNYLIELKMVNENGKSSDAYVELRENACDTFALNEDMYMMRSSSKADLYTFAGNYDVAANVLSMNNHIVPVGMDVKRAGTYRFTMPSDFSGTVTLIDTETGVRTNLALGDYEVSLPKGTSNTRFLLEIDIHQMPTAIDGVGGSLKDGKAHKFIENGQMYILQNGIIYDAQGRKIK